MKSYRYMADISSNNGSVNLDNYSQAGHVAIAIKATQGERYKNPYHDIDSAIAHDNGLTVVHYHYCSLGNIAREISNFRDTYLRQWRKGDYCCFDVEIPATSFQPNIGAYVRSLLRQFESATGHKAILYTGKTYAEQYLGNLPSNTLWWIADYSNNGQPKLPKNQKLFAWQYSDGNYGPEPHYYSGIGKCDGSVLSLGIANKAYLHKALTRKRKK